MQLRYYGDDAQTLAERPPGVQLTVEFCDPNAPGVQGEINAYKIQLRISSAIVFHTIKNHLKADAFRALLSRKDEFMYWSDHEQREVYDGLTILKMITEVINPDVLIDCKAYEKELSTITLKSQGNCVRKLISRMQLLQQRIQDEKGTQFYDDTRYLEDLFRALESATCEEFRLVFKGQKNLWIKQTPGVDKHSITADLLTNLDHEGSWGQQSEKDKKIIALTTKTEELKKQVKTMEKSLTTLKNGEKGKANASRSPLPEWRITKKGQHTNDPDTGKKMVWCDKRHGKGMYMPDPHDCDAWAKRKAERDAAYKEKRRAKRNKPGSSTDSAGSSSTSADKETKSSGKLKLDGNLRAALTTQLRGHGLSDKEIEDTLNAASKE